MPKYKALIVRTEESRLEVNVEADNQEAAEEIINSRLADGGIDMLPSRNIAHADTTP